MARFLPSLLTIALALTVGCLLSAAQRHIAPEATWLARWRVALQKLCMLVLGPIAFTGAVWILPIERGPLLLLPAVGVAALASGFLAGTLAMRVKPLPPPQSIGFRLGASFTNLGAIGGLVVFVLLGESAFSMVPFYTLCESLWYYAILLPYARRAAIDAALVEATRARRAAATDFVKDPFFLAGTLSIVAGLAANLLGWHRPALYGELNAWLVPANSALMLLTVGTQIRVGNIARYFRPALALALLRLAVIPACSLSFALLVGFAPGSLALKTIAILALMPIGLSCLLPASLYRLDGDLISTSVLVSTLGLAFSVPLLAWIVA